MLAGRAGARWVLWVPPPATPRLLALPAPELAPFVALHKGRPLHRQVGVSRPPCPPCVSPHPRV